MSLLVPCETLTDVSDVSDMSHVKQDENKTENETNGDELNNNSDNDIQKILIETEKNLEKIIKINSTTFDKLVNQFQLSLLKQLKHSLEKLKIDNSNNTNSENESKDMEMIEYNEHKSNTDNLNVNYNATDGSILGDADNLTVVSGATGITGVTGFTGVSSIAASLSIVDPLIIMMGVAEYDGLPYLDSVIKDYDNVIATFVKYWKYKVFYKLNNNKYIYTNNINDIDNNYAVKWDCNDIDSFIEESRKQVVQNKHDGLMFFISSHGDQDDILYDSECEIYELNGIFGMYAAQSSALLQSYSETEQESNHLLSIPKIFFLDMCRGPGKAKVTKIEIGKNQTTTMDVDDGKQETKTVMIDETKEESKPNNEQADNEKKTQTTNSASDPAISLHNKNKTKEKKEETFSLKGINKEDAHTLVGQMANFSKIYANTEGFSVMGGSEHGGIFMRSVCRVFKDTKYVQNHKFTNIIFKIREYTKREATLKNNLVNFTQIVENEGTLERQVVFGSKYISSLFSHSMLNNDALGTLAEENDDDVVDHFGFDQENDSQEKLCITNLSFKNKIAILVEMEQNRENRMKMFETLEKSGVDDNYNSFIENGFVIIDEKYGSHEFVKVWDEYYVTMFALANDGGANTLFDDRKLYFDDYLYFKENKFHTLHESDLLPKCNKVGNECHSLNPVVKASSEMQCRLCSRTINSKSNGDSDNVTSFECKSCQEFLCKDCCVSLIVNKIPQKMQESKYFEMQIVNTSSTYKIAVLINIYDSFYNKERYNMIKSKKYKEIIDEKGFIDNGFLIINNGDKHTFKTVWQSACITVIRIGNGIRDLVFDRQRVLDKYPLYYINTNDDYHDKLIYMKDLAPQIVGLEQKTKKSMEITLKKPLDADTILLECKIQSEITNGIQIVKNQDSTVILDQNDNTCHEMELNIDELEKEFKESQLNYNVKSLVVIDPKNQMQCSLDVMKSVPIFTRIVFDYSCAFTTLNGIGRYGPTNMDEYKGQCHYSDTKLHVKTKDWIDHSRLISFFQQNNEITKGMQLWTIPKSGKYKVICCGAKGGYSICKHKLLGGNGAKVGSIFNLWENDIIQIVCGQKGQDNNYGLGGGGGGGSYFILHKIGNKNPNYKENEIVNIPLIIAAGGNGACSASRYKVNGIDGLCSTSENRNNYGGYKTNGQAGRGASFKNDFDIFKSYKNDKYDFNKCNPKSFLDGSIGGERHDQNGCDGGFGGGGGSSGEGGGGGGYIGGLVSRYDPYNKDCHKYDRYGALSYISQNVYIIENVFSETQQNNSMISISGQNSDDGKIEIMFMG